LLSVLATHKLTRRYENDPRVSVIVVVPDEIRYWITHSNTVTRTAQVTVAAATGKATAPGELRTITKDEVCVNSPWWYEALILTLVVLADPAHPEFAQEVINENEVT